MKTHILKLSGENLSPYIIGNIVGIIDVITGVPDKQYPNRQYSNGHCEIRFMGTEEQCADIMKALDKRHSGNVRYEIVFKF